MAAFGKPVRLVAGVIGLGFLLLSVFLLWQFVIGDVHLYGRGLAGAAAAVVVPALFGGLFGYVALTGETQ